MSEYDYKEEANKLKEQRNLPFDPIRSKYSNIYKLEKMLSDIYSNNLETYKKLINKALYEWNNEREKEEKDNDFDIKELYCSKIREQIFPFIILID